MPDLTPSPSVAHPTPSAYPQSGIPRSAPGAAAPKRFFIVDAMALAFRSFYAFGGRPMTTAKGESVSVAFGTAMFLHRLIERERPDYFAIALDSKEPTFRHQMYPAYKANRDEMPAELAAQLPGFYRLLAAYGCPVLKQPGVEADDLIGTLARRYASDDLEVFIVSGDKDFTQLVTDRIRLFQPKKGDEYVLVDRAGVVERFGVPPEAVIDCLALIGDASDNVPGVKGIGEKGAAKLIGAHGSLAGLYANLDAVANVKLRQLLIDQRANAELSRVLVTIKDDCPIAGDLTSLACDPSEAMANAEMLTLFREMEFRALTARVEAALAARGDHAAIAEADSRKGATAAGAASPVLRNDDGEADDSPLFGTPQANARREEADASAFPATPFIDPNIERAAAENDSYLLVNDKATLKAVVDELMSAEVFCFDTETTGLDVTEDRPIGASFSVSAGAACYIPLVQQHLKDLTEAEVLAALAPVFARQDALKVGHNIKFDLQMLGNIGIEVSGPFADTMVLDHLLDAGARSHGLDACCLRHLKYEKIKTQTLIGARGELSMLDADIKDLTRYACEDADLTLRLYRYFEPQLIQAPELARLYGDVEMPLIPVLARMERRGIFIDGTQLREFSVRLGAMVDELTAAIWKEAGEEFNVNSPKQLSEILFTKLKLHEVLGVKLKKTKTGFSTDEEVLAKLTEHPLPRALLEYRSVMKLKGTYVDTLPELVSEKTGRVHTSFHQTGTATGRLSSSDPNLQNIPIRTVLGQEIRKAFRAGEPGWVIISADYSQVELRLLAHLAGEEALLQAFAAGEDIHRSTAARIFGVEPAAVDTEMRSRAKAINFGIIYGMGARRLAATTGVSLPEAQAFIDRYFETYPGISRYVEKAVADARDRGYAVTIGGRRRPMGELFGGASKGAARWSGVSADNVAVNSPIQGSAADLVKAAMVRADRMLTDAGLKARMLLQVHDELVFECPKAEVDAVVALVREAMQGAMQLNVTLEVGIGVGETWLEAH